MNAICDAHEKKVDVEQLYNPGEDKRSISWRSDQLEKKMLEWGTCPREAWPPVEQPRRTGKKRCNGHKSGGQYVAVLFGLQLPLTVKPLVTLSNPFK